MSLLTLAFAGTVAAGGELTLSTKLLNFPFMIRSLHSSFALGCDRTTQIRFFLSPDGSTPTTGKPSGQDLLLAYSQVPYLIGDDEQKSIPHEVQVRTSGHYLKVYAYNTDVYSHTIDCQIIIDTNPPEFD